MRNQSRRVILVDELETRSMLSGFGHFLVPPPDAAVVADRAKIQTDTTKLFNDIRSLSATLQADRTAIDSAINANAAVATAKQKLTADRTATATTIHNDIQALFSATTGTAAQAAFAQLRTDLKAQATTLQGDQAAIRTATQAALTDPGVVAAKAKLTADSAPITADQAALQADYAQLFVDLKAEYGPKTPTPTA